MFNLRRVFAFWATVASILSSVGWAQAQTGGVSVTIPTTGVSRPGQDYSGKVPITQINYQDCLNDDPITFTLNLGAGYNNYALEIWAGSACDTFANRQPATATCWKVDGGGTPNNVVFRVTAKVRDILAGRTGGSNIVETPSTGGTGGTSATGGTGATDAVAGDDGTGTGGTSSGGGSTVDVPSDAPSACITTSSNTTPQKIGVYFLLLDGSNMSAGQASWQATYKLTSSAPPDVVRADTGENMAPINWSYNSTTADMYINGYQFYCDPAPGEGVVEDPNILPTTCPASDVLKPGTRPADKYKCGTADKTSQRGNATGLENNVPYNIAVATTDTYRNIGVISTPGCAIPQPVTGFFEAYRDAGGEAGGFCSFSRHGRPVVLLTVFGLALGLMLRRRRAT